MLGHASQLPTNVLPKNCDIFKYFKYLDEQGLSKGEIYDRITAEVIDIWSNKGNLPTIKQKSVRNKLETIIKKGQALVKTPYNRRESYMNSLQRNKNAIIFECLFDICSCSHKTRNLCDCPLKSKVPETEWPFLVDQRTNRKMRIDSSIDVAVTKRWARRDASNLRILNQNNQDIEMSNIEDSYQNSTSSSEHPGSDKDVTPPKEDHYESNQNRFIMDKFLDELDRYNVTDMCGAALITAIFEDIKWITADNNKYVFDRFKISRQRRKRREERVKENKAASEGNIKCIGIDGKRDKNT